MDLRLAERTRASVAADGVPPGPRSGRLLEEPPAQIARFTAEVMPLIGDLRGPD